jgi:hypothetical protein
VRVQLARRRKAEWDPINGFRHTRYSPFHRHRLLHRIRLRRPRCWARSISRSRAWSTTRRQSDRSDAGVAEQMLVLSRGDFTN